MRDGWVETNLLDVVEVLDRFRKPINATERESRQGSVPYYGANGQTGWIDDFLFDEELVLLGEDAIDFADPSARKAYLIDGPSWVNNHAHVLRAKIDKVESYFLAESLNKVDFSQYVSFGTRSKLTQASMNGITIPLPPLPEQKRIVDLISSVDSYIEALQQQLESAKRSRNAVLHELLSSGSDDWETTTIGDISDFVSVRKSPEQLSEDSIYVGLEHLEPNNTSIDNFDSVSKVTSSLTPFDVGDVLFGRLRPYLHKVAIAEMFGFCSPEILVLRANSKVLPQMLLLFCDADSTINICVERSAGTRMPRTSTEDLASIEIKLPPIVEQIKLAELFSTFDTEISHLGIALEKSRILRSGLLSDLLSGDHEIPSSYDKVMGAA